MPYRVTKSYGHELGLSACFRQHRATSHCRFLHGYALAFKFVFEADTLDDNNWVIDFGSLKPLKQWLVDTFDHKLVVAEDDPALERLKALGTHFSAPPMRAVTSGPVADVIVFKRVGCEAFAELAWNRASSMLDELKNRRVLPLANDPRLVEVECREHGANGASYMGES